MSSKLTVEVWSDIACPWCWVGKRRLEAALARFEVLLARGPARFDHAPEVEVIWRAFELDPSAPPLREGDYVERLARKYGLPREGAQAMIERMVETGAREGLHFDFARARAGNSFLAHRLLQLARERGLADRVQERMFRGYFSEGAAIGLPEEAQKLAVDAGLDADEANAVVSTDLYADAVRDDQRAARELGVDGVPFFLLGRRYAVAGAQPAELLLKALEQTWVEARGSAREQDAELPVQVSAGPVCGANEGEPCSPDTTQ